MKIVTHYLGGIILGFTIIILVQFFYLSCFTESCLQGLFSNLISSLIALLCGIPSALYIDRRIKDVEINKLYENDRKKELEILNLVKEELDFSLNSLFLNGKKGNTESLTTQPLKSDLWESISSSDNINYLVNPKLLNRIISAYYVLKIVKEIEHEAYISLRTSAIKFTLQDGQKKNAAQLLLEDARNFDSLLERSILEAISMIENRLKELNSYEE